MTSLWVRITLQTEVALTEASATVGGHRTLGFIPGACLLGAAAENGYPKDLPEQAFRLFHSGRVRFGAGLPEGPAGEATVPMPFALHYPKAERDPGDRLPDTVLNLSRCPPNDQPKQLRKGFLTAAGHRVELRARSSMRTAVDRDGRAREGFLYTVSALPAGSRFLARIDADDAADLEVVKPWLLGVLRLGRSRRSEFGRAKVEPIGQPRGPSHGEARDGEALFLCVSDLCLRSPEGMPTFEPRPQEFGLPPDWGWDPGRSFVRTRRYSPFHGKRMRPDLERQVIEAGSVLFFSGKGRADSKAVDRTLSAGVGAYRESGLGQVLFEPELLAKPRLAAVEPTRVAAPPHPLPAGELGAWLERESKRDDALDLAWKVSEQWVEELLQKKVRLPASQWGEIRRMARQGRSEPKDVFLNKLREHVVAPPTAQGKRSTRQLASTWGRPLRVEGRKTTLGERLLELLEKADEPQLTLEIFGIHIVRAQRALQGEDR